MSGKVRLGKTSTSRTRAKEKTQVQRAEELKLKEAVKKNDLEFIDYLLLKGYSSSTVKRYLLDMRNFERWAEQENTPIETVGYNDIVHYIQSKKEKVQQNTISAFINGIKHYFNYLVVSGAVKENPVSQVRIKGIKRKKLYSILSKKELEELYYKYSLEEDEQYKTRNWYQASLLAKKRNKVIIGLMIYQGLNATELKRLSEKDIKLREGKIFIAGTRRSNERELKLESVQILDLMEYSLKTRAELIQLKEVETDQLLISTAGKNDISNVLFKLIQQLKIVNSKVSNLKQIRTSVITHWLKIHNLREAQYMAGHRYVSSTEAYRVNDLEGLQEDITKFHPIS